MFYWITHIILHFSLMFFTSKFSAYPCLRPLTMTNESSNGPVTIQRPKANTQLYAWPNSACLSRLLDAFSTFTRLRAIRKMVFITTGSFHVRIITCHDFPHSKQDIRINSSCYSESVSTSPTCLYQTAMSSGDKGTLC